MTVKGSAKTDLSAAIQHPLPFYPHHPFPNSELFLPSRPGLHQNCGTGGVCHQGSNWWSPFPKSWATMFPATVAMVSTKTFLRLLKPSLTWLSKGLHRLLSWFWFFRVLYIHISQKDSPPKTPNTQNNIQTPIP